MRPACTISERANESLVAVSRGGLSLCASCSLAQRGRDRAGDQKEVGMEHRF